MAKGKEESINFEFDESPINVIEVPKEEPIQKEIKTTRKVYTENDSEEDVSCLRNERIAVRFIPRERSGITNPKHVLYGGMAESATRHYTVPLLASGAYMNVLTNIEKKFLEKIMGVEYNTLSVYKTQDNFWANFSVRVTKQDTFLDLSNPTDYIKYKVLLANKDFICPSLTELEDRPKITYQFVLVGENEDTKTAKNGMSVTMECYKEYGKIENEGSVLRVIVETIETRPLAPTTKLEFLQTRINTLIQSNPKTFLKVVKDPFLPAKVLIKECIEAGLISNRGNFLYVRDGDLPLCNHGEEPTLNVAAKFLNLPKNQALKFTLEAKLK